jgi:hypothetical protein
VQVRCGGALSPDHPPPSCCSALGLVHTLVPYTLVTIVSCLAPCPVHVAPLQPGNPYSDHPTEPYNRLQAAASTISAGPVAPSDMVGGSDPVLIMKSCMKDGRLLQVCALCVSLRCCAAPHC